MRRITVAAIACLALAATTAPALAQNAGDTAAVLDRGWAEAKFTASIEQRRVSCIVIAVADASGHSTLMAYGLADEVTGRKADAETTRVLIASVTKTFTATAIAQLLDDGKLRSLDEPANDYLRRAKLPPADGEPITIRDLLTHRSGLDIRGFGMVSRVPIPAPVGADFVASMLAPPVRRRGDAIVYSNLGFALLGALAEDVTGSTLQARMRAKIFEPLGMHSTELSYLPQPEPTLARAYVIQNGRSPEPIPFEANTPFYAPAGSIRTTASDMARYITAQLKAARGESNPLFSPERSRLLTTPSAFNGPGLPRMGLSYFLDDWNGVAVANHAGAFAGFSTQLVLVPERGVGMFAAWVGTPAPGGAAPLDFNEVMAAFLTHILGPHRGVASPVAGEAAPLPARKLDGTYWRERRPHQGLEVLLALDNVWRVTTDAEGRLTINGTGRFVQVQPGTFALQPGVGLPPAVYAFSESDGRTRMASAADIGWRRRGMLDPLRLKLVLLVAAVICTTGCFAFAWRRRLDSVPYRRASWTATVLALFMAAVPVILLAGFPPGESIVNDLLRGASLRLAGLTVICHLLPIFFIVLAGSAIAMFRDPAPSSGVRAVAGRIHMVTITLAVLVLNLVLWQLDVLGHFV